MKLQEGRELPPTIFGQPSADYIDARLVTIFMVDNDDWIVCNDLDDSLAPTEDQPAASAISMSVGTARFIESMDEPSDSASDVGTILEVPSSSDMAEFYR